MSAEKQDSVGYGLKMIAKAVAIASLCGVIALAIGHGSYGVVTTAFIFILLVML